MTAQDYPVTFPYGATTNPYTPASPHRGNDRACPLGTPIIIGGTKIGLTGNTGTSTGPHLHTQAGFDFGVQKTTDPTKHEFRGGTVVALRTTNTGQWGKFVTIKNTDGIYVTYAHLSLVNVTIGQVIKEGEPMLTKEEVQLTYMGFFDVNQASVNKDVVKAFTGKPVGELLNFLWADPSYQKHKAKVNAPPPSVTKLTKGIYEV